MPRRAVRSLPVIVLGATLSLGACAAPEPLSTLAVKSVNIEVGCVGDTVAFALWPWVTHVEATSQSADEIDWTMSVTSGTVVDYEIVPTGKGQWPYREMTNPGKGKGQPNVPLRSGRMNSNAQSGTYQYAVQFNCTPPGGGTPLRVLIDPDVVVDRSGTARPAQQ